MKIKKGDTVKIITGKSKGKSGKIIEVAPDQSKILVEGINVYKKHVRPRKQGEKGQIVDAPRFLNASNAMIVCPSCKEATRIGVNLNDKSKVRICKKCKAAI